MKQFEVLGRGWVLCFGVFFCLADLGTAWAARFAAPRPMPRPPAPIQRPAAQRPQPPRRPLPPPPPKAQANRPSQPPRQASPPARGGQNGGWQRGQVAARPLSRQQSPQAAQQRQQRPSSQQSQHAQSSHSSGGQQGAQSQSAASQPPHQVAAGNGVDAGAAAGSGTGMMLMQQVPMLGSTVAGAVDSANQQKAAAKQNEADLRNAAQQR